jgi:CDP-diacylglycerol--serine O-phosphatidyltransferase
MVGPLGFVKPRNLLTYVSVAAALAAMMLASGEHGASRAGALLAVAALADLLDGRFARLFASDDAQKRFGVQIDSLADAVTFGVAPVVCLGRADMLTFAASIVYVLAALTRLGFYNLQDDQKGFVGVPTTIAGIAWSGLFLLTRGNWIPIALVALGAAMVAPIPFARPRAPVIIALVVACLALIAIHARAAF